METRQALRAAYNAELQCMWNAIGLTKRASGCGQPFGAGPYRWHADGRRDLDGCSTCADPSCPGCGTEEALRRWALTTLAVAQHQADGGQAVMVSIAGRHSAREPVGEKARRLKAIVEVLLGRPFRQLRSQLGVVGVVRRLEPTFGGMNGCHPNAHLLLLLAGDNGDLDERAAHIRTRLATALAEWACGRDMSQPQPHRWEIWERFSSPSSFVVTAAGTSAASYLAKLEPHGGEIAGASFELTDPAGVKATTGNIGDRAFTAWAVRTARAAGYGPRRFRTALINVPVLREATEQFRQWRAATSRWHLFRPSQGLFAPWEGWTLERLILAASDVAAAEDLSSLRRVLGLREDEWEADTDTACPEPPSAGCDAPDAGDVPEGPLRPERPCEAVWIDQPFVWAWWDLQPPDAEPVGGMLGALGLHISTEGPWATVAAVADAARRTGGRHPVVLEREPQDELDEPVLWLTDRPEAVGVWLPVEWTEVGRRARQEARWALCATSHR